ncbi:MAG: A/G-specific adenine glycosylase [Candidatus Omnitrophica bacterium CG11_big_fil_rev_8_21_14_0_20_45_26]|uniref:Adenine DNA glycosylase n=1 Tax=Candidatus Abzuiibacterium crystallinum TaxID=1974748 RepID=A0A2H0LMI6_9BACT|nr:MAG: A/G-specific adenine glycosylase [Candidatus Omnitrophica bacterium CG11_big_fil_rev_8_21_14_0_20_45_26]
MKTIKSFPQAAFQKKLLKWYQTSKRPLPWRQKKSAYGTLVSEIMLQQTQIKTVIPYYGRWLKTFPTIQKLAKAPLRKVLKLWEGLGYYSRARNLHRTAQTIDRRFQGQIPSDPEILMMLPGIGRYTAGAIASIAYDQPVPLVDGNVARVFSRIFLIKQDILKPETQKLLYTYASSLVSSKQAGNFNQALMELGALICTPALPECSLCPVRSLCCAYQNGVQETLPVRSKGPQKKKVFLQAALLTHQNKILVQERPAKGIWGGLWELPNRRVNGEHEPRKFKRYLEKQYRVSLAPTFKRLSLMKRELTHLSVVIEPFQFLVKKTALKQSEKLRWILKPHLKSISCPVPYQQILQNHFESKVLGSDPDLTPSKGSDPAQPNG